MGDCGYARRQLQIADVDRLADGKLREIDLDKLRQILWQARNVQLSQDVTDDRTGKLHRGRVLTLCEVQRHFHMNLAVRVDALKIDMQYFVAERVHLHVAE